MKKTNRQLQKEQTKELLLKTAYEIFSERGIINTRMSDIARAAGVSHGTIFVHFQTQEVLIEEVIETYCQKVTLLTHALADSCGTLEEFLRAHLSGIMEFELFYTRLIIENQMLPAGARDSWVTIQSAVALHFSLVYEREADKEKKPVIPMYMLFNMWMGLVHYYLENGDLFAPEGNVVRRYGDFLISNYLKLIKC
ncbi:MAG TPA: TetR/AcrR family transcriptional regulator [Anaerovoracaceae bacterium]|nr:TetR/AcrR family transcriptional regulator [Anaerovoracaceae bacterium]